MVGGLIEPRTTGNIYSGSKLVAPNGVDLGRTHVGDVSGGASAATSSAILRVHNEAALGSSIHSTMDFAVGYETDGQTPCVLASISAYGASNNPVTTAGSIVFATRQWNTMVMTERMLLDASNDTFRPFTNNLFDLGLAGIRFRTMYAYTGDFTTQVKVNGVKVLGGQGAALPADDRPADCTGPPQCDQGANGRAWAGSGMSVGLFSLADAAISQIALKDGGKKAPPKRTTVALGDQKLVPEPR